MPAGAVFLSYASEDGAAAERIATALRAAGIEVWFDKSELRGGDAWDRQIREQIHHCRLFIPVISTNSERRDEGYFRREWSLAADRTRDMAHKRAFLVPVVIDGTPERGASVPEKFHELQWTRLLGGETPPTFVERVRRLLSPETPVVTAAASTAPTGSITAERSTKRVPPLWRLKPGLWATGVVLAVALAYFGVDKFWISKRTATAITSGVPQPANAAERSIAVLPFVDLSEKHDQEYFADGMAEEVLDLLANLPGLKVIGRTSSFQFKGKNQDLRAIGSALGASYVVEGSVRKSGDRLRVTAQLIDARDGSHLWSDTYDEPVGDALKVQDQIAFNLVRALQVSVGADFQLGRQPFKSAEAYDLYLRGRHAYDRFDKEGLESAAAYFQQALKIDPTSVLAAELLAAAQEDTAEIGYVEPSEGFERARQSAQRALRLDSNSSLAHAILASVHLVYDWDWPAAEREATEALRLKPRSHSALGLLGMVYEALGKWVDSAEMFESALAADPLFLGWHSQLSNVRLATGRLQEAETESRRVLQISPTAGTGHYGLGVILLMRGKIADALAEMQQEQPDTGRDAGLAIVYHAMGRRAESDGALAAYEREYAKDNALWIADAYAYRGELDQAFAWLERAYRQKDSALYMIKADPFFKNLHADPRYKAFLRKMNLPE